MPSPPLMSRRFSVTTIAGLTAIAAWCIRASIQHSGDPDYYYQYHRHPAAFVIPIRDVINWVCAIAVETVIASWLVWRARAARATSMGLALVLGVGVMFCAPFAMHAPPYLGMHIVFLVYAASWLALAAIVGWIAGYVRDARVRARERAGAPPVPAIVVSRRPPAAR